MFLIMSRAAHYENPHVYDTSQHGNGFKQPWNTESFITVWSSYRNMTSSKGQCQILAGLFKKTNTVYLWDRNFRDELCLKPRRSEFVILRGNHNFVNNIYVLHWIFFFFLMACLSKWILFSEALQTQEQTTQETQFTEMKFSFCTDMKKIKATQTFFWKAVTRLHLLYFLPGDAGQGDPWVFVYDWTHTTSYELQFIIQKQEDQKILEYYKKRENS